MRLIETTTYKELNLEEAVGLLCLGRIHPDLPRVIVQVADQLKLTFGSVIYFDVTDEDVAVGDGDSFISHWRLDNRVVVFSGETRQRKTVQVTKNGKLKEGEVVTF